VCFQVEPSIIYQAKSRCSKVVFKKKSREAPFFFGTIFIFSLYTFFHALLQIRRLLVLLITFWFSADTTTIHTITIIERDDDARSLKKKKKKKKIQTKTN